MQWGELWQSSYEKRPSNLRLHAKSFSLQNVEFAKRTSLRTSLPIIYKVSNVYNSLKLSGPNATIPSQISDGKAFNFAC